jgi:uncharacterized damage-inducible protein DinB
MMEAMKLTLSTLIVTFGICASAAPASAQAPNFSLKGQYETVKGWVMQSAAAMPEADYAFKPTPEIRSFGQLLGHIANSTGMICTIPAAGKSPLMGDAEKLATKAEVTKALAAAFAACDAVWASVTPAWNTEVVNLFGADQTKIAALTFNTAHTFEHYGNIVTYLRLKGIVPPSSGGM